MGPQCCSTTNNKQASSGGGKGLQKANDGGLFGKLMNPNISGNDSMKIFRSKNIMQGRIISRPKK